jgi:hypothetical protein
MLIALLGAASRAHAQPTDADRDAILSLAAEVPLVLRDQGFEAYAGLFHPQFSKWFIESGTVRERAEFLADIRHWNDAGNRAVSAELKPVSLHVDGDVAVLRSVMRERFRDVQGSESAFTFRATTVFRETGRT